MILKALISGDQTVCLYRSLKSSFMGFRNLHCFLLTLVASKAWSVKHWKYNKPVQIPIVATKEFWAGGAAERHGWENSSLF